jgi:hypothetical protein
MRQVGAVGVRAQRMQDILKASNCLTFYNSPSHLSVALESTLRPCWAKKPSEHLLSSRAECEQRLKDNVNKCSRKDYLAQA